jgi:DNA-binding transcriptional ArsR family regulator
MRSPTHGAMELPLVSLSGSAYDVLLTLKKRGEARAEEIAEALGVTPSGVRQHLSALRAEGLVAYRKSRAGPGRPKFAYRLWARQAPPGRLLRPEGRTWSVDPRGHPGDQRGRASARRERNV